MLSLMSPSSTHSGSPVDAAVRCYRAAIALNNTAVSLLERRAYRKASAVFTDSINILNILLQTKMYADKEQVLRLSSSDLLDQNLQKAGCFLAEESLPHEEKERHSSPDAASLCAVYYEDLSVLFANNSNSTSRLLYQPSSSGQHGFQSYPIIRFNTILPTSDLNCLEELDLDLECAAVVYNMGVAVWCESITACTNGCNEANIHPPPASVPLQDHASKLFKLSHKILSSLSFHLENTGQVAHEKDGSDDSENDDFADSKKGFTNTALKLRVFVLTIVVLKTYWRIVLCQEQQNHLPVGGLGSMHLLASIVQIQRALQKMISNTPALLLITADSTAAPSA